MKNYDNEIKEKSRAAERRQNGFVTLLFVLLAITVAVALYLAYENKSFTDIFKAQRNHTEEFLYNLEDKKWEALSINDRLDLLQIVHDKEAANLSLKPVALVAADIDTNANYNMDKNKIYVSVSMLEKLSAWDNVFSVIHETRHIYQRHRIFFASENPDGFSDAELLTIEKWKNEFDSYTSYSENPATYGAQLVEQDANDYAQKRISVYDKYAK